MTHVRVNVTRNFDHNPEPLVQGIGGKVVLGGAHGVVAADVLIHQTTTMLERLDPLGEAAEFVLYGGAGPSLPFDFTFASLGFGFLGGGFLHLLPHLPLSG
jgi:hypothetical protein